MPSPPQIIHAYRTLYRTGLRALKYHLHHRRALLTHLRHAFRTNPPSAFSPQKIANTVTFLRVAARRQPASVEYRVLVNLLNAGYHRERRLAKGKAMPVVGTVERGVRMHRVYEGLDWEVRMLNESMGMCLQ
ncbi:DUF1763-domain-containing protein [Eremomyces bilateralis CBS 781.70]|uniref:DUF1763-domain-containing protein n=1 Tax=Eremomyces bilateralis CBS 781.70 TaxID=1392243 RepID=A0A6G1G7V8_9PEZI|nr:DUF1763-domain-containing protein [Eremomyces bilateralis CBS 781.70]KAF1814185.1 DUF1763-domain-containing protein [Eremomyces bilateralis CBS 781.70]